MIKQSVLVALILGTALLMDRLSNVDAQENSTFIITTRDELCIKEVQNIYRLEMKAPEFLKLFGPPEKKKTIETNCAGSSGIAYDYVNDGLVVVEDKQGKISSYTFSVGGGRSRVKSARVETDTGITTGASLREIVRIHGEPYKRVTLGTEASELLSVFYKSGSQVLQFGFQNGRLSSVSIRANFLPCLEKM